MKTCERIVYFIIKIRNKNNFTEHLSIDLLNISDRHTHLFLCKMPEVKTILLSFNCVFNNQHECLIVAQREFLYRHDRSLIQITRLNFFSVTCIMLNKAYCCTFFLCIDPPSCMISWLLNPLWTMLTSMFVAIRHLHFFFYVLFK